MPIETTLLRGSLQSLRRSRNRPAVHIVAAADVRVTEAQCCAQAVANSRRSSNQHHGHTQQPKQPEDQHGNAYADHDAPRCTAPACGQCAAPAHPNGCKVGILIVTIGFFELRLSAELGPLLHQRTPQLDKIAPVIGALDGIADSVSERGFD